jgi:Zn-dependent metalloprotease
MGAVQAGTRALHQPTTTCYGEHARLARVRFTLTERYLHDAPLRTSMTMTSIGPKSRLAATASLAGLAAFLTFARPSAQAHGDQFSSQGGAARRAQAIAAIGQDVGDWDRQIATLERQGSLRLGSSREDPMLAGRVHDRYDQYFGEARVFGAQVVRQRSEDGTLSVFGQIYPQLALSTATPKLAADQAAARAAAITGRAPLPGAPPELVVLPLDEGGFRLTWYVRVFTGRDLIALFLDAETGDEVFRYSDLQRQSAVGTGTGVLGDRKKISARQAGGTYYADDALRPPALLTYDLKGNVDRTYRLLDGVTAPVQSDVASDTDNTWTDGANVDAHVYSGFTYDYYWKRFDRRGFDGNNSPIRGIVHPIYRSEFQNYPIEDVIDFLINAFWCGGCGSDGKGMMLFGEGLPTGFYLAGSGQSVTWVSGAVDVVAHEFTHAVTGYSSNLIYRNESGALNEAFSDIMGTSVEFWVNATGARTKAGNYTIGEDWYTPFLPGSVAGIRSMSDPAAFGDPDHYSRRYTGTADNGGVHTNSGIANHAFYLAIEGGTNRTSGLTVTGVGAANREQIERVFFRAFTQFLPNNATFSMARGATLRAATDLYGNASVAFRAVEQAWNAVGVQ